MKKKIILLSILLFVCVTFLLISNTNKNEVISSNINNNIDGLAFYVQSEEGSEEYTSVDTIPSKNDGYIFKEAVCNDNTTVTFNDYTWSLNVSNMENGRVRCKLYFDIDDAIARKYILSQNTVNEGTPDFSESATTNEGIFTAEDDYGTSYYYRGNVNNNYFYFAGYYWRIIRINGDGTIRLIYQGKSPVSNGVISNSNFNSNTNNNTYLGYMYKLNEIHGTESSSTIKSVLENWYFTNISEEFRKYINNDQGFCQDRNNSTEMSGAPDNSGGTGTTTTYYAGRHRVFNLHEPSLKCDDSQDLFTTMDSQTGNNAISYPIGLINVDEVSMAGGLFNNDNTSYYLYTGEDYWVLSPSHFSSNIGYTYNITTTGNLYRSSTTASLGVRPVININKNVELEGNGTSSDPYKLKGEEIPTFLAAEAILANSELNEGTPDFSETATTDEGLWTAKDNLGTSYYFRGSVENNYVQFAGYYWRIIRINGDGSIRIIYDGTSAHVNGESSSDRQTGTSIYNNNDNRSYYVGYTYTANAQRPSSQNGGTASTIKGVLDTWYQNNIVRKGLDDKVVGSPGFCNDRNMASGYSWSATSSSTIYYATYGRLHDIITRIPQPTIKCTNNSDLYTTKIGLITADEVSMAGGVTGSPENEKYYLYTGQSYWTLSPYSYFVGYDDFAGVFVVSITGVLANNNASSSNGIRPVINLKSDTEFTGSGTTSDPYVVN